MPTRGVMRAESSTTKSVSVRTALVAQGSMAEVTALQTVLRDEGIRIEVVTDARELLTQAKLLSPEIILIDTTLAGMDTQQVTRILSRNPSTASAAVLLVVAADADDRTMRRMKELAAFAIIRRPLTCAAIRENFRNAIAFANEAAKLRDAGAAKPTRRVSGCDALLKRSLICPFHSFGVRVNYFQLRAGKIMAEPDLFDVPVYKNAVRDGDFVDYTLAGLTICRECHFVTNDPNYFDDPESAVGALDESGINRNAYRIDPATRGKVAAGASVRGMTVVERLKGEPTDRFYSYERTAEEALVAYELAIESSKSLYEAAPVRRSLELLRLANYELRKAQIHQQHRNDLASATRCRQAATQWLERCFGECKGVAMYKASYQLLALFVHFGNDAKAFPYLTALKDQTRLSRRDQEDPAMLERYLRRAQNLWADRDLHGPASPAKTAKAA